MNEKAFTLIELMGVIVVLSILVMISVPVVDKYIKQTKSESAEVQKESLILAARNWASDNKGSLPSNGNSTNVTIDTLIELGYLDFDIYENLSNFEIDDHLLSEYDSIKITLKDKNYEYELVLDDSVDNSAPVKLDLKLVSSSVNTLTVKAYAEDDQSSIVKYDFNIDGERESSGEYKWQGSTGASVYTFKNITGGEHTVMFKVTNSKGLSAESENYTFNTRNIGRIEFVVVNEPNDCESLRDVRIVYPANSTSRSWSRLLSMNDFKDAPALSQLVEDLENGTPLTAQATIESTKVSATYNVEFKIKKVDENGVETTCVCGTTGCE